MGYRTLRVLQGVAATLVACWTAGCSTAEQNVALGAAVVTSLAATTPTQEMEQTYYFGVLDPEYQLPCAVYRVRVHGQASSLSRMKFASGWAPAAVMDSLGTRFRFGADDAWITGADEGDANEQGLPAGRKLVLFGPEAFRPSPKDHRLVILMGADPNAFFQAVDEALGKASKTANEIASCTLAQDIQGDASRMSAERASLDALMQEIDKEMPAEKEEEI